MHARRALLAAPVLLLARPVFGQDGRARDAAALEAALRDAASLPRLRAVIVAREGEALFARAVRGPDLDRPVNVKSVSKSVVAALVGVGIARGVLRGVDQPVLPLLGRAPPGADPRVAAITVGHLLSMRAGLEGTSGANYGAWAASRDPVAHALSRPFADEPGGGMIYSTGSTHLLGAALASAAGRSLADLARDWLGAPLGIAVPPWSRDPQGRYVGGNDMRLSPRGMVAFGELYRNGGAYRGARVLPEAWVRESWVPRGRSRWSGQPYGYGWWLASAQGREVAYAWGYGGQMIYVVPGMGLTVAMTSDPDAPRDPLHMAGLHGLMAGAIMPALGAGTGGLGEALRVPEGV